MQSHQNFGLSRNKLFFLVYFAIPILLYAVGIATYRLYDLDGKSVSSILSIVPIFSSFYQLIIETFNADAGRRFFIIVLYLSISFLIQNAVIVYIAFYDATNPKVLNPLWNLASIGYVIIMSIFFIGFFFFPSFTMGLESRMARVMYYTDLKFIIIAGLFWLFHAVPYALTFGFLRVFIVGPSQRKSNS